MTRLVDWCGLAELPPLPEDRPDKQAIRPCDGVVARGGGRSNLDNYNDHNPGGGQGGVGGGHDHNDRYADRRMDIPAGLARDPEPVAYVVDRLAKPGDLTLLTGVAGCGKTWLGLALADGVARGASVAGIACDQGPALIVDAEMGERQYVERFRVTGISPAGIELDDARGLDLSRDDDREWLRSEIERTGARFVLIDSLRRLTPSCHENDSDDMGPVIAALAGIARETDAAILLIHHQGWDTDKAYRGSTAIQDQADAIFTFSRDKADTDIRRLACHKMRSDAEPEDRFFRLDIQDGIFTTADKPVAEAVRKRDELQADILANLPARTKAEIARALGVSDDLRSYRDAWFALEQAGEIVQAVDGMWTVVPDFPERAVPQPAI
jgi:KaiC/GvpD/RAD55 family RecA-like ATPase